MEDESAEQEFEEQSDSEEGEEESDDAPKSSVADQDDKSASSEGGMKTELLHDKIAKMTSKKEMKDE